MSFIDGTTILTTLAINASGVAQYATATLTAGIHPITAVYNGDAAKQIQSSTSAVLDQDVQAPTTATLTSSLNPSYYGNSVTFTATIPPSGATAPSGTVTFLDGVTSIGFGILAGNPGVATLTTTALAMGTHTITVSYPGDSFNGASSSLPLTQVVNAAQTSTTVTAAPSPGIAGGLETIAATVKVTSGASTPTGIVTFTSGTTQLGSAPVNAGTATIIPALGPGTYQIIATYSGDANDTGSASAAFPLTVSQAATQTALTVSPDPALVQQPITFTAQVTGNGGTPTGSVNFLANGNAIGAGSVNASGKATFTTSALAAGTYSITAAYTGDANDIGSTSGATSLTVSLATTTTAITVAPNPALVGVGRHHHRQGQREWRNSDGLRQLYRQRKLAGRRNAQRWRGQLHHVDASARHLQHHRKLPGRRSRLAEHLVCGQRIGRPHSHYHQPRHLSHNRPRSASHSSGHGIE